MEILRSTTAFLCGWPLSERPIKKQQDGFMDPFIQCEGLVKIYQLENQEVYALQGVDLSIRRGEMVGIVGASGSGKSTLMNILGGLDKPTTGKVRVNGVDLLKLTGEAQNRYRSTQVGFVWQQGMRNLVPFLNAEENIILLSVLAGIKIAEAERRASDLLEIVGLTKRRLHRLDELSGGEQQRVAIAVGLVNRPQLLLADEPTGELDTATSTGIFKIFQDLNKNYGMTIVIVSHDPSISRYMDRVVAIRDGKIASETVRILPPEPANAEESSAANRPEPRFEEVILLDSAGRLQLPREYLERLKIKGRVKLELKEDSIWVFPAENDLSSSQVHVDGELASSPGHTTSARSDANPGASGQGNKTAFDGIKMLTNRSGISQIQHQFAGWPLHQWLVLVLILIYLLPIWLHPFIPTQDGPSHLYNSQVLAWSLNPASNFHQFYNLRLALFPNWLTYLILAPLMFVVPALIAEKILLSIYVILFPLSVWYLLDSIRPGKTLITLASFGLIYNYLLLMGFYNFVFSLPLVLIAIGYWWKHRQNLGIREIVIINLLMVLIWFGHIVGYAIALFAICFLALLQIRSGIRAFLKTLACTLPSTFLFFNYYLGSNIASELKIDFSRIPGLLFDLLTMKVLVSYNFAQAIVAYTVAALFGLLVLSTVWMKLRGDGNFFKRLETRDYFILLILCLLVFYLLLPWSMGPGGWLNDRFALLINLLLLAWFLEGKNKTWRVVFTTLATCVALVNAGYIYWSFDHFSSGLAEYTSGTQVIEKGRVILPIFSDGYGGSDRVGIYVNAANYYALDNGAINLGNYEVQYDYFPVMFKDNFVPPLANEPAWVQALHWEPQRIDLCAYASHIDYLETWGEPTFLIQNDIQRCFSKVFENGRQTLYVPNAKQ